MRYLNRVPRHLIVKFLLVGALFLGLAVGMISHLPGARAQSMEAQTFVVQAGGFGPANIEALSFFPRALEVHQGDTVEWYIQSFHNIHFEDQQLDLVVAPEVNGQPLPQINPAIAFPTIQSGATYSGGDANSGLPVDPSAPPVFSLVLDLAPGTYRYLCDVHPGMVGAITVVADDVAIPSPAEVSAEATSELLSAVQAASGELQTVMAQPTMTDSMGVTIQAGSGPAPATINQFFPFSATITAGQSVTWSIPTTSIEPHTVTWPPLYGQDVNPIPVEGGPPILALGASIAPMTASGSSVGQGDTFQSGMLLPGQSFSLTFTEPGVYPYTCAIHPGMTGTITVLPAE